MYRSAETSSFARDDVVGRRRGAASGVWGARTYYSLAAAGRNRGDERGVRLELDAAAYLTRYLRLTFGQNDNKTGVLFSLRPTPLGTQNRVETGGQYDSSTTLERVALSFCPKPFIIFVAEIFLNEWLWGVAPCPKMHQGGGGGLTSALQGYAPRIPTATAPLAPGPWNLRGAYFEGYVPS